MEEESPKRQGNHVVNPPEQWSTAEVARLVGYSAQQVRDLERLGVLPPALRAPNGYRRYGAAHVTAARAYRALATAIGPVDARALVPALREGPIEDAASRIDELHAGLAVERRRVREALRGLDTVLDEASEAFEEGDAMTIGELARALGVRPSALRHWEREDLVRASRPTGSGARVYGALAVTEARTAAALRAGGYRIPAVRSILDEVRAHGSVAGAQRILQQRLVDLAARSVDLLAAAGLLHDLLRESSADEEARD
ncbi:MAG: MerR family transcriptional regulator [Actinobacteria bacterium]|nr:MerR family transcriptional regulator [Actinomycetota bacterium]